MYFIRLRVITQTSHSKFLTTVLNLSPQGCPPVLCILAECQVQSPIEVCDSRVRILWESLQPQGFLKKLFLHV